MTLEAKQDLQELADYREYASDLQRCIQTAELLFQNYHIHKDSLLREMNFGERENQNYEMLKNNDSYRCWMESPFSIGPEEGEDFPSFASRIRQGLGSILTDAFEEHLSKVAVITHGGVIRLLLDHLVTSE